MMGHSKPLVIDLFCGLGGFTEGFLLEGWDCIGFDIERHQYGEQRYPAQLVVQDVLTLHGSQFKNADLIVASPPCQEYSYMAMPWSKAKAKAAAIRADKSGGGVKVMKAVGGLRNSFARESKDAGGATGEKPQHRSDSEPLDYSGSCNLRNVWTIATAAFSDAHFATFPPELAERCIKAGCPVGGHVLDPFGGAGTTGLVADRLQRHATLIELNPEYAALARRRIDDDAPLFAGAAE